MFACLCVCVSGGGLLNGILILFKIHFIVCRISNQKSWWCKKLQYLIYGWQQSWESVLRACAYWWAIFPLDFQNINPHLGVQSDVFKIKGRGNFDIKICWGKGLKFLHGWSSLVPPSPSPHKKKHQGKPCGYVLNQIRICWVIITKN